ncbi:MAG: DUF6152 family protein [Pseudomonadota bacterium]
MRLSAPIVVLMLMGATTTGQAHHSFAPHFDPSSSVTITGKIVAFRQRNPHAYLHIEVAGPGNEVRKYECESSGITQLRRNGIDSTLLKVGSTVTVTGEQHRRDPLKCFFRTVQVDGGPVYRVSDAGGQLKPENDLTQQEAEGILGNWLLIPAGDRAGNGETYERMLNHLSDAGRQAEADYEPIKDDPVYTCHPIGLRRVWYAPETPTSITPEGDRILIRHEWMDVERTVFLDSQRRDDGPREVFGHSIGHMEDGVLTIETDHYPYGLIRQYLGIKNEPPFRGLLHSDQLETTEILRYDEASKTLEVTMLFKDAGFYTRDFPPVTTRYERTDLSVRPFNCTPDRPRASAAH